MSVDPALLIRRWPERRPVVLAVAAIGFAAVAAIVHVAGDPDLGVLHIVPVLLVALELGPAGGLVAATIPAGLVVAGGAVMPAVAAVALGAIAGRFSSRMHAVHAREQRLLESANELGELAAHDRLSQAVAAAALRTPGAVGVAVGLDGRRAVLGDSRGHRTVFGIVVRGEQLGLIDVAHSRPLEPEDRAALERLALQAGLAADNQRLLAQEREAAAMEAELRHIRDDLLEQRAGLGQLLDAQEDERRRHAETLHEELAQVLSGVLMQLRVSRGGGTDDGLHDEVRGVLAELRDVATALRPSSLAHLGVLPALESIDGLAVEADDVPDPLPEPLRTGVYRLVEHLVSAAAGDARVRLQGHGDTLDVMVDAELADPESVAAARARVALLGGSLGTEAGPCGRTCLRAHLPLRPPADPRSMRHALRV
jgi:signal transduction histidine kinase